MDIHQLQCFYNAALKENMTKAADAMNMSQPALSIAIRKLEDELGIELFIRNGKKVMLSRSGKRVLPLVSKMLQYQDEIFRVCKEKNDKDTVFVKLMAASPVMLNLISKFSSIYSKIKVYVCENDSIIPDVIVNASVRIEENDSTHTVCQEKIVVAVPRVIAPIVDESMLYEMLYEHHVIGMSRKFAIGRCEDFYFKLNNINLKHAIICDSIVALRTLLSNGTGIAFVPNKTWLMQNNPLLNLVDYPGIPWIRYITLQTTNFRSNHEQVNLFMDFMNDELSSL